VLDSLPPLFQVNRPDSEHIVPITEAFIEFYTVLDAGTGWSLQQAAVLAIFEKHGLPHVPMSHHHISELSATISAIRGDATREGAVLYLHTADGHVVGLVKVKASVLACRCVCPFLATTCSTYAFERDL
jgi:hypothetical protein